MRFTEVWPFKWKLLSCRSVVQSQSFFQVERFMLKECLLSSNWTNLLVHLTPLKLHWWLVKIVFAVRHLWSTWNTFHHLRNCHKIHSPCGTKKVAECRLNLFPLHFWEKEQFSLVYRSASLINIGKRLAQNNRGSHKQNDHSWKLQHAILGNSQVFVLQDWWIKNT